jgi:hypothetical protein
MFGFIMYVMLNRFHISVTQHHHGSHLATTLNTAEYLEQKWFLVRFSHDVNEMNAHRADCDG